MEKFIRHTGIGAPLRRSAVDTDQIIPAVYLKRITRTGFEDALFAGWRANEADFILNQDAYKRASILVAGPDFGTGSSREHAVWALKDYGFKVVLAPRFADIFRGNAGKQGLVAGVISQDDAEQLWKILETEPGTEITVDLRERTVEAGGMRTTFQIDDYVRWTLMEGLDDISLTLQQEDEIVAYERARPGFKPATLPARHLPKEEVVPARAADMPVIVDLPIVDAMPAYGLSYEDEEGRPHTFALRESGFDGSLFFEEIQTGGEWGDFGMIFDGITYVLPEGRL